MIMNHAPAAKFARLLPALIASLFLAGVAQAKTLHGTVVKIYDGDTLTLQSGKRQYKVRLAQIDAPEKDQPYGQRARLALTELAYWRDARVEAEAEDKYGRVVGTVWVGDYNINQELVRRGMAWVYTQYAHSPGMLALQQEAHLARRGLWSDTNPVPPWEWRHANPSSGRNGWGWLSWLKLWKKNQTEHKPSPAKEKSPQEKQCGSKQTCREMSSCEEARFYLEQCGLTRLDGNGDGIPCESLCR